MCSCRGTCLWLTVLAAFLLHTNILVTTKTAVEPFQVETQGATLASTHPRILDNRINKKALLEHKPMQRQPSIHYCNAFYFNPHNWIA